MMHPRTAPQPTPEVGRVEHWAWVGLFVVAVVFHGWGMTVGWESKNLPGVEYRQAQTALSAYWIKQGNDFSLAYPTPVLGKPWSVPMEFPLYQWTVVVTGKLTGWGLTKAGRAVSIGCFYLMLPALFLLLGRWGVAAGRRWLVLAVVVSCPFYVFYARAFLIETMALLCALWFWVGFERAVQTRRVGWLVVAAVAGTGAGLVKVTTFLLYLLPAGAWALVRLWRGRREGRWRSELGWMAAAVAVPFGAAVWWVWLADRIKAANPLADFLSSAALQEFNLGSMRTRFSAEMWQMKWRIVSEELTWLPLLGGVLVVGAVAARHRLRAAVFCGLVFVAALWVFPVLYALHPYYYVANTVALLLGVGLLLVGLAETPRLRRYAWLLTALLVAAQMLWYHDRYYPVQRQISLGGDALTEMLRAYTKPGEVLVITGEDWNSYIPYYAQRRALMLREDEEGHEARAAAALRALEGERIGAVIVSHPQWQTVAPLVRRLTAQGIAPRPWLRWRDCWIYFPESRWAETVQHMSQFVFPEVSWVPGAIRAPEQLGGHWHAWAELTDGQRRLFAQMKPTPVRFYCSFEPSVQQWGEEMLFSAHPWTRLVFWLPRGRHTMKLGVWFNPDALKVPPGEAQTDGVEIRLQVPGLDGRESKVLANRVLDPVGHASDRDRVPVEFSFDLERDGEVELVFDPGAAGRDTRDWVSIRGPLRID